MPNLYTQLKALLDPGPMQIGQVSSYEDGVVTVDLHGGGQLRARGQATLGGKVFVRDGVILGPAPDLPVIVDVIQETPTKKDGRLELVREHQANRVERGELVIYSWNREAEPAGLF